MPGHRAGQHLRGHELGRQVRKGSQHEPTLPHPRMGDHQVRLVDRLVPDQEHVCVERAGSEPYSSDPPRVGFELSASISSSQPLQPVWTSTTTVEERALFRTPDGFCLVQRRHRRQVAEAPQALNRFAQPLATLAKIGAQTDEGPARRGCGVCHGELGTWARSARDGGS